MGNSASDTGRKHNDYYDGVDVEHASSIIDPIVALGTGEFGDYRGEIRMSRIGYYPTSESEDYSEAALTPSKLVETILRKYEFNTERWETLSRDCEFTFFMEEWYHLISDVSPDIGCIADQQWTSHDPSHKSFLGWIRACLVQAYRPPGKPYVLMAAPFRGFATEEALTTEFYETAEFRDALDESDNFRVDLRLFLKSLQHTEPNHDMHVVFLDFPESADWCRELKSWTTPLPDINVALVGITADDKIETAVHTTAKWAGKAEELAALNEWIVSGKKDQDKARRKLYALKLRLDQSDAAIEATKKEIDDLDKSFERLRSTLIHGQTSSSSSA